MKIALINENSQAAKNGLIEAALKKVVEPMGHEVVNYGMYAADDKAQLTYVQCGILAAILLNSGAADYVITGCGTGEGAMLALNSFPGVICGHVEDPVDAYTFAHVNDGNAVAMPFAKGFGWGGELNLEYCFEKLFGFGHGQGYPKERVEPEQRNKKILDGVRAATFKPLIECLQSIDQDLLKGAIAGEKFRELFFASCKDDALAAYVKSLLESLKAGPCRAAAKVFCRTAGVCCEKRQNCLGALDSLSKAFYTRAIESKGADGATSVSAFPVFAGPRAPCAPREIEGPRRHCFRRGYANRGAYSTAGQTVSSGRETGKVGG